MQITQICFQNYRNLNGLTIQFPTDITFIIGENGIGKSNILNALSKIFIYGKFSEHDFTDPSKEIRIDISLILSNDDIGSFDEYTDPSNHNIINLIIKQDIDDYNFKVYHLETGDEISPRLLKKVHYIYYDSLSSWMTTIFYQLICEISSKDQEGTRKMEVEDILPTLVPNFNFLSKDLIKKIGMIKDEIKFIDLQAPEIRMIDKIWATELFGVKADGMLIKEIGRAHV